MNAYDVVDQILEHSDIWADLSDFLDDVDIEKLKNTEVRVATQPNYPLTHLVKKITSNDQIREYHNLEGDDNPDTDVISGDVVWLAAERPGSFSRVNPYAPQEAWYDF